jgi:hypothetical protein
MQEVIVGADEVAWNELSSFELQEYARTQLEGFETFMFAGTDKYHDTGQIALSWRSSVFAPVASGYTLNNKGAAHITPSRGVLWVLLRHLESGKLHYRQVTHAPHHIEVGGQPRVAGALLGQNDRAKSLFLLLAGMLVHMVAQGLVNGSGQPAPVFGSGDLNVNYLAEKALPPEKRASWFPYTVLGAVADIVVPPTGTHGARIIDWGWAAGGASATAQTLPRGTSDHNPVLFEVTLP